MLQQIDYSFYNDIESKGGVITEELLWERLRPLLDYLSQESRQKVQEALSLAYDAHGGQSRRSGEKYVTHPLEVARILAELHMDGDSLVAGLLHDTVEDTTYVTLEEIGLWFGEEVMKIVEGETRFSKLSHLTEETPPGAVPDLKALDLQQLFLAMTDDVRIIVVKLADRLHNMRTLSAMPQRKQQKIADETLRVFAPLARLLGLYSIKEELEALSFLYTHPIEHAAMVEQVNRLREQQRPSVEVAIAALENRLDEDPYLKAHARCSVSFHTKALYSLHRKLQLSRQPVKDLRDVAQLRIIIQPLQGRPPVDDRQLCYHVMGLVHTMWAPIPGKVKDYIATPKPNGYQSIHTTVLPVGVPSLVPLELHVRTSSMHRVSQYGVVADQWPHQLSGAPHCPPPSAPPPKPVNGLLPQRRGSQGPPGVIQLPRAVNGFASWPKGGKAGQGDRIEDHVNDRRVNWLSSIREWQEEFLSTMPPREFVDCVTDDLFGKGVFVFTPSGQSMRLPKGATVVDFAYHVHTDIGNHMKSAVVNGAHVTPDHQLSNAEVVEIVHDSGKPGCAVTAVDVLRHKRWKPATRSARHKVAQFIKAHEHLLHPDPDSPDGRMMRHGILERVLDMGHPQSAAAAVEGSSVTWLLIRCSDRPALLADIAQCIASHDHNIVSYEGRGNSPDDSSLFIMQFAVTGRPQHRLVMIDDMRAIQGVASVELPASAPSLLPAPSPVQRMRLQDSNGVEPSSQAAEDSQTADSLFQTAQSPSQTANSSSTSTSIHTSGGCGQTASGGSQAANGISQTTNSSSQTAGGDYSGRCDQGSDTPAPPASSNGISAATSPCQQTGTELPDTSSPPAEQSVLQHCNGVGGDAPGRDDVSFPLVNEKNGSSNSNSSSSGSDGDSNSASKALLTVDDARNSPVKQPVKLSDKVSPPPRQRYIASRSASAAWFRPPFA